MLYALLWLFLLRRLRRRRKTIESQGVVQNPDQNAVKNTDQNAVQNPNQNAVQNTDQHEDRNAEERKPIEEDDVIIGDVDFVESGFQLEDFDDSSFQYLDGLIENTIDGDDKNNNNKRNNNNDDNGNHKNLNS